MKVIQPQSPFLLVRRLGGASKEDDGRVAMGMEVAYSITFKPETPDDFSFDLVVCTEREKFVVPIVAVGKPRLRLAN